jgi:tetraacyldisaccharide 4'-kinase
VTSALVKRWYQGYWLFYFLWPLTLVYRLIITIRKLCFKLNIFSAYQSPVPVIVVGNITVGGSGKTPLIISLVEYLQSNGFKPAVVSRGYGGQSDYYPASVQNKSQAQQVGDEPLAIFLRTGIPVVVDPLRSRAVQYIIENYKYCNVIISDDGLQHYALARDIEIAVIDGARGLGSQQFLPMGPLRESPARLKDVDFVVINGEGFRYPNAHYMALRMMVCQEIISERKVSMAEVAQAIPFCHAVAGIGYPDRFFQQLRKHQFVIEEHAFPDHYAYTAKDFQNFENKAIVMTEKDAVKCFAFAKNNWWYIPVHAEFSTDFLEQLLYKLNGLLEAKNERKTV